MLLELDRSIKPVDRAILAPLVAYLARHSRLLRDQASRKKHVEAPTEIHKDHPASATLFRFKTGYRTGLKLLTCVALCALLEASGPSRNFAKRLLSAVRGALGESASDLALALGAAKSIPDLVSITDQAINDGALPLHFRQLWEGWLRDTLFRWMLSQSDRLRQAMQPVALLPTTEDPVVPISLVDGDPENATALDCFEAPANDAPKDESTSHTGRAATASLDRRSEGDLLSPPDIRIPRVLDQALCRQTVRRAHQPGQAAIDD
jgi:hypothetical protein